MDTQGYTEPSGWGGPTNTWTVWSNVLDFKEMWVCSEKYWQIVFASTQLLLVQGYNWPIVIAGSESLLVHNYYS